MRAKFHILEAKSRINDYTTTANLKLISAPHPDRNGQTIVVAKTEDLIPTDIELIVGDAIHNLRTALDHLAGCLSVANGKSLKGVSFPFSENLKGFNARAEHSLKKISPEAKKLIFDLKPYGGGNELLYLLSKLDNRDKHQTIFLCATYAGAMTGKFSTDNPIEVSKFPFGSLHKGIHMFTYPSGTKFEQSLNFTIAVTFADISGFQSVPVIEILQNLTNLVESIMNIFGREIFNIE